MRSGRAAKGCLRVRIVLRWPVRRMKDSPPPWLVCAPLTRSRDAWLRVGTEVHIRLPVSQPLVAAWAGRRCACATEPPPFVSRAGRLLCATWSLARGLRDIA